MKLIDEDMLDEIREEILANGGYVNNRDVARLANEQVSGKVQPLVDALRDIYEQYAGMEGFKTETAPEAYQKQVINSMAFIAQAALKQFEEEKDG